MHMANDILVVTTSSAVADTIRSSLNETGSFRVQVVSNKAAAVVKADEDSCSVAILDFDLGEYPVSDIGQALRTINASIKLIVLCQDEMPPALDAIRPWTLLQKPMHLRELIQTLDQPSATRAAEPEGQPALPWLQDVSKAAQYLTRLTLESSAQAALITRKNILWAYAGGLSQDTGNEVAQTVSRNWDGQKSSDLLRFVRLESTKAEHMLYATRLTPDLILALVFDAETPFSTIRSQANQLISTLGDEKVDEPVVGTAPLSKLSQLITGPNDLEGIEELDPDDEELVIPPISNILTNIPSPNPETSPVMRDETVATMKLTATQNLSAEGNLLTGETRRSGLLSNLTSFKRDPAPPGPTREILVAEESDSLDQTVPSSGRLDELEVTAPSRIRRPETPVRRPEAETLDETRPSASTDAVRRAQFEPISAGMYHLTYACLLVPRFTSHYLTGDLADRLAEWLPRICIAFGWRLEFLAVRPEYLQWVVNVQPNTSPGYLMKVMRTQTSEKIFTDFERIRKENPSGDFWAPGYLIMGGTQPHPPQLVKDYIKQTRERQGVSRPPR